MIYNNELLQVVVDHVKAFQYVPTLAYVVIQFIDHIEKEGKVNCFICNEEIGPGYALLAECVIIRTERTASCYGVCPDCSEKYEVAEIAFDQVATIPGMRPLYIHPHVGYA